MLVGKRSQWSADLVLHLSSLKFEKSTSAIAQVGFVLVRSACTCTFWKKGNFWRRWLCFLFFKKLPFQIVRAKTFSQKAQPRKRQHQYKIPTTNHWRIRRGRFSMLLILVIIFGSRSSLTLWRPSRRSVTSDLVVTLWNCNGNIRKTQDATTKTDSRTICLDRSTLYQI